MGKTNKKMAVDETRLVELAHAYRANPTPANEEALLLLARPIIDAAARRVVQQSSGRVTFGELISYGWEGLRQVAQRVAPDPARRYANLVFSGAYLQMLRYVEHVLRWQGADKFSQDHGVKFTSFYVSANGEYRRPVVEMLANRRTNNAPDPKLIDWMLRFCQPRDHQFVRAWLNGDNLNAMSLAMGRGKNYARQRRDIALRDIRDALAIRELAVDDFKEYFGQ